jgi:signal transduction histidine kinase/PAS domain-containing protein
MPSHGLKSRVTSRWKSIERQLPLLISGLLLVTVVVFAWAAYQRVRHVLMVTADQRLQSASLTIDAMLAQQMEQYAGHLGSVIASKPALAEFLETNKGRDAARQALGSLMIPGQSQQARIELRRPDGTVVLDTLVGPVAPSSDWAARLVTGTTRPVVGPLRAVGDSTYSQTQVAVVDTGVTGVSSRSRGARVVGYVTDSRLLSGEGAQTVRELIGAHALMLMGSPNDGVWTDLTHRRSAPPLTPLMRPSVVRGPDGEQVIGVLAAVPGTPWFLWTGQALSAALAPMRLLLVELATLAALIILVGASAAWAMSRRITSPIVILTEAAERIAAPHSTPESSESGDEIARLGDAFRRMSTRVRESLLSAEAARTEAVATADQLQTRTSELEEQTRQARALAEELEEQFEEAQSLSEELDQSNAELQRSALEADTARRALGDIVESITDALVVYDRDWRVTFINQRAAEQFRQQGGADPLEGQIVWEMFPELRGTTHEHQMQRAMHDQLTVSFESTGKGRWLAVRAYPTRDGGVTAVWTDVTEARRDAAASEFLAEASKLLSASLDVEAALRDVARLAVPALADLCLVDIVTDPKATDWPPQLTRLAVVHQDPAEIALVMAYRRRHPIDWKASRGLAQVLRTGEVSFVPVVRRELLLASAVDEAHLAELRAFGFTSFMIVPLVVRGRPLGACTFAMTESGRHFDTRDLALARNLADRAAIAIDNAWLYRETDHARTTAEAANKAKLDFLASMSHELRTPLNAIAGYVQLLDMQLAGPVVEEQRRFLARIARAQNLLLGRINDMLNFVKIGSGTLSYAVRPVRVHEMLAGLDTMIHPQLTERGLTYEYVPPDSTLRVSADAEKLEQILLNLLSNALKFTPTGGQITLASQANGSRVDISVSDTGVGIPASKLHAIFEPFIQLSSSLTRAREGTGLGLAISRDLARGMGGELSAVSTPGAGSTFTLSLPIAAEAPDDALTADDALEATA